MTLSSIFSRKVIRFLLRMLALYAAWHLLYDQWLLPDGRLDAGLSRSAAVVSGGLLHALGLGVSVDGRTVLMAGTAGVTLVDGCNGLTTMGLFAGFVLAFPGRWRRRVLFLPLGFLVIYLVNVGRIVLLLGFQRYWPAAFRAVHGLGAPMFFYLVVFALWMGWAHYGSPSAAHFSSETASLAREA